MTDGNKHRIGDGPRQMPVWLRREEPLMLTGLDEWPKVGEVIVIYGESWRLVEISDRWVCEREASSRRQFEPRISRFAWSKLGGCLRSTATGLTFRLDHP